MIRISDLKTGFNAMLEHAKTRQEEIQINEQRQMELSRTALEEQKIRSQSVQEVNPYSDGKNAGPADPDSRRKDKDLLQKRKSRTKDHASKTDRADKSLYSESAGDQEDHKGKYINYIIM